MTAAKLDRVDAWNRLVLAEGKAMTEAAIHRLLNHPVIGPRAHFAVLPASIIVMAPSEAQKPPQALAGRLQQICPTYCVINEVYQSPELDQWRFLPCFVAYGLASNDAVGLMADWKLDLILYAEPAGLSLLGADGQLDPIAPQVSAEATWTSWRTWSLRRSPASSVALHALDYPVMGWTAHYAFALDIGRRLEAAHGKSTIEAARHRIMAGKPSPI